MKNNIVLLDYDGYIAKSYYAGRNKEEPTDFEECYRCLFNMEGYAIEKAMKFFNCDYEDLKIIRAVSGHTYKTILIFVNNSFLIKTASPFTILM